MRLPVVLVLASGRGERFIASGGTTHKLDAWLHGKPVLDRTLDAVRASGLPWHLERSAHAGMGDCIAAAVRATQDAPGWLVLPGDLPLVSPSTLRQVADALDGHAVAVPAFQGERGHPVGFSAVCREGLLALTGDVGAASVVKTNRAIDQVIDLEVDDAGIVTDIDTVQDLARAQQILVQRLSAG